MLKRILCCVTLLTGISSFGQPQFFPTGGNNPSHVTVGGGTNSGSGTTYTAGAGITIAGTVISTNGSSASGTNITVVGSTNLTFTTNQVIGTTYTNNYSVPITIFGGIAQFNSTGSGNPSLTFNGAFLSGQSIQGPVSGGVINVSMPDFIVQPGSTWNYQNTSTGTGTVTLFPSSFQVSLLSPVTPTVGFITAPVSILNGGTGQTTASAALTALGGMSSNGPSASTAVGFSTLLITPTIQPPNGANPTFFFAPDTNPNDDQGVVVSGSPFTSGGNYSLAMVMSNAVGSPNANGYYPFDPQIASFIAPGLQATNVDGPGTVQIVVNSPAPLAFTHPQGSSGNLPGIWIAGDTNGFKVEIPYNDGISNHIYPLSVFYIKSGSNVFFQQTNEPKLFEVDQNQAQVNVYNPIGNGTLQLLNGASLKTAYGTIITAGGQLSNAVAFNKFDPTTAEFGNATVKATNFFLETSASGGTSGYLDPSGTGWVPRGAGQWAFFSSGNSANAVLIDNTGINPTFGNSGTPTLGASFSQEYGLVVTKAISTGGTATGSITATGYTNILGTNVYVNCIGTAVAVTIKNNAGTPVATNTVATGGTIIPLQPGGSISAASGLTGTYWVQ